MQMSASNRDPAPPYRNNKVLSAAKDSLRGSVWNRMPVEHRPEHPWHPTTTTARLPGRGGRVPSTRKRQSGPDRRNPYERGRHPLEHLTGNPFPDSGKNRFRVAISALPLLCFFFPIRTRSNWPVIGFQKRQSKDLKQTLLAPQKKDVDSKSRVAVLLVFLGLTVFFLGFTWFYRVFMGFNEF